MSHIQILISFILINTNIYDDDPKKEIAMIFFNNKLKLVYKQSLKRL